jgi:hypothetical protein
MASEHVTGGVYTPENAAHQHHVVHDRTDRVVRRISPWAVLAGALVGVVVMFLLGLLGLGIGLATIDPAAAKATPSTGHARHRHRDLGHHHLPARPVRRGLGRSSRCPLVRRAARQGRDQAGGGALSR